MSASSLPETFPRSLLFVPANRTEMFSRAFESEAHAIVFDLEDSVPVAHKVAARDAMVALQRPQGWTNPVFVRVNALETENFALDVRAVASVSIPLAGLIVPKVERAAQVRAAAEAQPLPLLLLIETPGGVMRAAELADCGVPRIAAFAFGAEDYRAGMGVDALDPALADFARATVSNAAAAAGVPAIDAPMLQLDDPDRLHTAARRARALGFQGMFAIHPAQVPVINEEFAHGALRGWALRAVEAYERATRAGHGSVALDGRMIDEATMKRARDILK